jgi:archaellum component FlaC
LTVSVFRPSLQYNRGFHRDGRHDEAGGPESGPGDSREYRHEHSRFSHAEGPERIAHMMEAVKHLRAAGLNEPADNIEKMARHMREELEHARRESAAAAPEAEHMQHAMQEMHGELQKMAHAIDELREQVAKMRNEGKRE